jgi:hypothetical protein
MTMLRELSGPVVELMRSGSLAEFTTISAAGVPIDTVALYFPSEGLRSFDLATGLAYPAKAERARRNPKVGLLIEGGPGEPVISIAGSAAVRDSDLQANLLRYLSEAGYTLPGNPDWSLARKAVWYWTRIIVEVAPVRVMWWQSAAAMDDPPRRWDAPSDATYPESDPAPPGPPSRPPKWEQPPWQELARRALARGASGHLSLVDGEGYPVTVRARAIEQTADGFALEMPNGVPWSAAGLASLSFRGVETFVGTVTSRGRSTCMRVDRALPLLPMTNDPREVWDPSPDTHEKLMLRLRHETQRRGLPIPSVPVERPKLTEHYERRMARSRVDAQRAADFSTSPTKVTR